MTLSYKNYAKDEILKQCRNINYASLEMLYGLNNKFVYKCKFKNDLASLTQQADIVAQELLTKRSVIDFKKFLGSYQTDWLRLLHEVYVYDRCKCIYYGLNSIYMDRLPSNTYSFPGNVLLLNLLKDPNRQFFSNDSQPYSLFFELDRGEDFLTITKDVRDYYTEIFAEVSEIKGTYSFVNYNYESILNGLFNSKNYIKRNHNKSRNNEKDEFKSIIPSSYFEIIKMDDRNILSQLSDENFPFMNSFLSNDSKTFNFIIPSDKCGPEALRFNESIAISRALGITADVIEHKGNKFHISVPHIDISSPFVRDDVYSVTGIKSEILPLSEEQVLLYLKRNTFKSMDDGDDIIDP